MGAALTWAGLMLLLGLQLLTAGLPGTWWLPPTVGMAMALLVCFVFMRLRRAGSLSAIFALAGAVWVCILLGTGALDPATRHDIPVPQQTTP